jgi:hypothetical protein
MSTYTFAAVEARKLAGEMVPMDASQAGEGKLAFTLRRRSGSSARSARSTSRSTSSRTSSRRRSPRLRRRAQAGAQTPLSALLLAELERRRAAAGWLNVVVGRVRDRRRARRGRARRADHVHRLGDVGWSCASARRRSASTSSSATRRR